MHRSRSARGICRAAGVLLLGGLVACGAEDAASITDRLWVSDVPSNPREEISAFAISNLRGRKLGALYQGSLYQGTQRGFRLELEGRRAVFEMLQDGSRHLVTVQTCKPTAGFHFCIELHGDPAGGRRYQSRKRWSLGRSKEGHDSTTLFPLIPSLLEEFKIRHCGGGARLRLIQGRWTTRSNRFSLD